MRAAVAALWLISLAFALTTLGFLVALFVFGFQAALTPGPSTERFDAAFLSFLGALLFGALTAGGCLLSSIAMEEVA